MRCYCSPPPFSSGLGTGHGGVRRVLDVIFPDIERNNTRLIVLEVSNLRLVAGSLIDVYLDFLIPSSVNIVSDYGLDDRAIGVRSPAGAKDFSFILCVQTGSGAHPASCTMGTGGSFLRG
jgi:hypothetical protein